MKYRDRLILQERNSGKTLLEIAIKYGVSKQTVANVISNYEQKKEMMKDELYAEIMKYANEHHVAIRIYNALNRNGICTLDKLRETTAEDIFKIRNLGTISMAAILKMKSND